MSTRTEPWAQGTPSWVDLSSPEPAASHRFYGSLLGWQVVDSGDETGDYGMCLFEGGPVAGIGPRTDGDGAPPAWLTYLAVDDVEKVAEGVAPAGGALVVPPTTVGEAGRMAVAQDPTGAVVGLWQAGGTIGFERYNEPGSVLWNEHLSRDPDRARDFYGSVFGYRFQQVEGHPYWTLALEDGQDSVAGLGAATDDTAAGWMTYFMVESVDAAVATVPELGGRVVSAPWDEPFGRTTVVTDPHGAVFALMSAPQG
jgi:hypothetical protein